MYSTEFAEWLSHYSRASLAERAVALANEKIPHELRMMLLLGRGATNTATAESYRNYT